MTATLIGSRSARRPITAPAIAARKGGDTPLVMVTAYDAPSARVVEVNTDAPPMAKGSAHPSAHRTRA